MQVKQGDKVFINTSVSIGESGELIDIIRNDNGTVICIIKTARGEVGMFAEKVFPSKEAAVSAYKHEFDTKVEHYCAEIKTIKDLIVFPSNYVILGDCRDKAAAEAYRLKAKELANIDVLI